VVQFEASARLPPGSALTGANDMVFALAIARGAVYTLQVMGPSAHSAELRAIAEESARALTARPPEEPRVYRLGLTVMRVASVLFACVLAVALVVMTRQMNRARHARPIASKEERNPRAFSTP
jgi:hypothetical protein